MVILQLNWNYYDDCRRLRHHAPLQWMMHGNRIQLLDRLVDGTIVSLEAL